MLCYLCFCPLWCITTVCCQENATAVSYTELQRQVHKFVGLAPKQLSRINSTGSTQIVCGCLQLFMLFLAHAFGGRMLELKPKPRTMLEGPWRKYWPCVLPWIAMQVVMSISWLHTVGYGRSADDPFRLNGFPKPHMHLCLLLYGTRLICNGPCHTISSSAIAYNACLHHIQTAIHLLYCVLTHHSFFHSLAHSLTHSLTHSLARSLPPSLS